ncbi:MAG TPA: hypothetical protein VGO11_03225 [Chthoniobacteraceae bacterium]|jgi:hypothetical protein|nr:hypothetical protein [Chthoniobacteraceae bacterium]
MGSTPFSSLLGGIGAFVCATLFKYRLLWFLHDDTILSGGRQVSTAEFAALMSRMFYIGGAVLIVLAFVLLFTLSEERRRRIAQFPRWQRFLFWPIDRHIAPRNRGS